MHRHALTFISSLMYFALRGTDAKILSIFIHILSMGKSLQETTLASRHANVFFLGAQLVQDLTLYNSVLSGRLPPTGVRIKSCLSP